MINIGRGKICRDFHPLNINNIFIHSKYSKFFFPFHLLISTRVETSDEKLHHFLPQLPFTLTPVMRRKRGSPPFPMILAVKVSRGRELVAPSITRITRPSRPKDDLVQGETKGDRGKECEIGVVEDNAELVTGEISDYYYFLLKRRIDEGRSSPFSFFAVNVKLAHLTSPPGKPWHTPISRAGKTKVRRSPLSIERGNTYSLLKYIQ